MKRQKRPKLTMINYRPEPEERELLLGLMEKTDRSAASIIRIALRKVVLEDLMCPLTEEPHGDDHNNGQN